MTDTAAILVVGDNDDNRYTLIHRLEREGHACLDKKRLRDQERLHLAMIEEQRARLDALLHTILPASAAAELKVTGAVKPRRYDDVAVLYCDVVGFTGYCDAHDPELAGPRASAFMSRSQPTAIGTARNARS
jgi:class 3 adenylate cyclase